MIREFLDFFDVPAGVSFELPPEEAIAFFRAKGLRPTFAWQDMLAEEHVASFTVAKMLDTDLLADVQDSLSLALESGTPFGEWADTITQTLQAKGWWGRQAVLDPLTGETVIAQLGSPTRLKTIFRTNLQSAYSAGAWQQIQEQADDAPFLLYDAVDDYRTRPAHAAWDGQIHPVDSSFWSAHYPPNGYNCRCSVIQLSGDDLVDLGLEQSKTYRGGSYEWTNPRTGKTQFVPNGIDPGFNTNAGETRLQALTKLALEKAKALPPELAGAAVQGLGETEGIAKSGLDVKVAEVQKELAAAIGKQQLERSITKTADRAAKFQIDEAIANNTPYLANALKQIQKTAASQSLTAPEILQAAKLQAVKVKDSANLANWKSAYINNKKLPAAGQAVFDSLPDGAQSAVLEQLNAQKAAIAAEKAAQGKLKEIADGGLGKLEAQILQKLEADPAFQSLAAQAKIDQVLASAASQKAKISQALGIAGFKKSIVASKIPTPAQQAAYKSLSKEDQAKVMDEVEEALEQAYKAEISSQKAAQEKPGLEPPPNIVSRPVQAINPATLVKISERQGSNPGGVYQDTETGVRYYIKYPDDPEAVRNEALAHALYRLAGVEGPDFELLELDGRTAIASKIIDGLEASPRALQAGRVQGVQEHFAVDAWLANWDVIGMDFDNTKLLGGRGIRIDPGGSLRYRAQAGLKGAAFGDEVLELDSLRNPNTNSQSASVFAHVTQADIEDGVRRILLIQEEAIREAIERYGPSDIAARQKLSQTILSRRDNLAKRYPHLKPQSPLPLSDGRVSEAEQRDIEAARSNGFTIKTDSDQIEDQHVIISTYTDATGKQRTRAALKVRANAARIVDEQAMASKGLQAYDVQPIRAAGLELLRGINARANRGGEIDTKTMQRYGNFIEEVRRLSKEIVENKSLYNTEEIASLISSIGDLSAILAKYFDGVSSGDLAKAIDFFDFDKIPTKLSRASKADGPVSSFQWRQGNSEYRLATFSKGYMTETSKLTDPYGFGSLVLDGKGDGVDVRWVPYDERNSFAAQGYLQIDVDGISAASSARVFEAIANLGLKSERALELDQLELYVERIAAIRALRNADLGAKLKAIDGPREQVVAAKIEALNMDVGFDMRKSPYWNPYGKAQAFGHGRVVVDRPDLTPEDVDKLEKAVVLYHNPEGCSVGASNSVWAKIKVVFESGGQLAAQLDRVRRGVPSTGSSVASDFKSGGAAYVFTRVRRRMKQKKVAGLYFRGRMALRSDSISYGEDMFGKADADTQNIFRKKSVAEIIDNSENQSNETNFKNAVSMFDELDRIVCVTAKERAEAIDWFRQNGYTTWPDGRALEDVIDWLGSDKPI